MKEKAWLLFFPAMIALVSGIWFVSGFVVLNQELLAKLEGPGLLIGGGFITWLCSRFYYIKASQQLNKEASGILKRIKLVMRGLEEGEIVKWNKDANGEPIGLIISLGARDVSVKTRVTQPKITKKEKETGGGRGHD